MARQYLIASHGKFSSGIQNSIDILANMGNQLTVIDAYITDEDYTGTIQNFIGKLSETDEAVIFTDLYGGSVNQRVVQEVLESGKKSQIKIITNSNLAVILSVIFLDDSQPLTNEQINSVIQEGQVKLIELEMNHEDEEDIFD